MLDPQQALAASARPAPRPSLSTHRAVVVGAGGVLGSAVLEQLLATHRFARVAALVSQPVQAAVKGFVSLPDDDAALQAFAPDTALVVFDRARDTHRREAALVRPQPAALLQWAQRLRAAGARSLVVVVPHRAAMLPMALQQGLATLDEAAVAALGFDQLVFMRMAQSERVAANAPPGLPAGVQQGPPEPAPPSTPQRLAWWMLSQMHWMAPQREQPVQPVTVAKVAAALAVQLPQATPATRVLPAQLLWHAAQQRDVRDTVLAWLSGQPLPALPVQKKLRL